MTDDLKQQFERLVADPPPPTAMPSESVFARVRTARRRRTAGALTLAAAAVVAVAVAAGNLADVNSGPPITNTPSAPVTIVTGPPTGTPSTTAPTTTGSTTTGTTTGSTTTGSTHTTTTGTPGTPTGSERPTGTTTTGSATTKTPPPVQPPAHPIQVDVVLKPTITGRTVSVKVTVSGTVIVPTVDGKNLPADTSFLNLSGGTNYYWGDGAQGGSDGGSAGCGGTTRKTGRETYSIETHTYAQPGTYTLRYEVRYCNAKNSAFTTTKTVKVTVK
ncbi:hypothetical protein EV651_102580 [Kribbella sp. VKM Ac-2571]|uniref:hypothetical protein n=1 Tax=Kribbella sp. VKM Ac-2571 TaxID=2512222 RepID=UPI00105D713D|nr:hypothetical protein [Kribbella sp. VKM Ac-2571]TDO68657.1 hypothetical protein EV651_102580 [Kribbella sp. VKM Ac-2571]